MTAQQVRDAAHAWALAEADDRRATLVQWVREDADRVTSADDRRAMLTVADGLAWLRFGQHSAREAEAALEHYADRFRAEVLCVAYGAPAAQLSALAESEIRRTVQVRLTRVAHAFATGMRYAEYRELETEP